MATGITAKGFIAAIISLLAVSSLSACIPAESASYETKYSQAKLSPSNVAEISRLEKEFNSFPLILDSSVSYNEESVVIIKIQPLDERNKTRIANFVQESVWKSYISPISKIVIEVRTSDDSGWRQTIDLTQSGVVQEAEARWGVRHGF